MKKFTISTVALLTVLSLTACGTTPVEISCEDAKLAMENPHTKLIDVREIEEHAESNITGNILIPLNTISENSLFGRRIKKDDHVIAYCRSGNRSMAAYDKLKELGYENVQSLEGGITNCKF
ncbi:rhodanese-like domain-containing protein [Candidatus Peregrinibacteria bacterium]|jgi:rhodanese-related sulfurtransferase|nr:rhodanese-like domain-containing protein [Candidatus Peregrinibacteria bacterium]MBT4056283.1 rhodanese-like domain-containing protein [Candidatus Peregrinibacteria bacterium]